MILKKIHISSFGKIRDFDYDFSQGLNTIKEDNGWGKSTLADFITLMFYGITTDSKKSLIERERYRYKTWNSTDMFGGYIVFEWGNFDFRLERFFGNKASEDTVKLIDLNTGKAANRTENLGERIFKIDKEGFYATTYFTQNNLDVKGNSSLTTKYSSVYDDGKADNYDKIIKKIDDEARFYKGKASDNKGAIADLKREIAEINSKIENAKRAEETSKQYLSEVERLTAECKKINNEINDLTEQSIAYGKMEAVNVKKTQYQKTLSELNQLKSETERKRIVLNGHYVRSGEIDAYRDCAYEFNRADAARQIKKQDLDSYISDFNIKSNGKTASVLFILSAILLVLSIVGYIIETVVGIVFTVLTVLTVALSFLSYFNLKNKKHEYEKNLAKKQIEYNQIDEIFRKYNEQLSIYVKRFNINNYFDYNNALNIIEDASKDFESNLNKIKSLEAELEELKADDDLPYCESANLNLVELKSLLNKKKVEYEEESRKLGIAREKFNYYNDLQDSLSELEESKENANEKLSDYVRRNEILTLTLRFMKQADENMKLKYRQPLQEAFRDYYKFISFNDNVDIDVDFKVTVNEGGSSFQTDFYSEGYKDLFNICKRFALIDVLFTGERPFIVLDDPFTNLDDEKLEKAKSLIKKLSEKYQIVYLLCHNSRLIN